MFKYGGFKLFIFKIFLGCVFMGAGLFILISLGTYDPQDPGIGKLKSFGTTTNFLGSFGALISSSFLFLFGIYSYVFGIYFFLFWFNVFLWRFS